MSLFTDKIKVLNGQTIDINGVTIDSDGNIVGNLISSGLSSFRGHVDFTNATISGLTTNDSNSGIQSAQNVGISGISVMKNVTSGGVLQFKSINTGSNKITISDDLTFDEIDIDIDETNVNHNALSNYKPNEHIDHTAVNIIPGVGLTGGGNITGNISIGLDIASLSEDITPDGSSEYLFVYDTNTSEHKKVLVDNLIPNSSLLNNLLSSSVDTLDIYYSESESEVQSTDTAYYQAHRLSALTGISSYLLCWQCEAMSDNQNSNIKIKIERDDTETLSEIDTYIGSGYGLQFGMKKVTLTFGTHNFDLDFATATSGYNVRIRRCRMALIKINSL